MGRQRTVLVGAALAFATLIGGALWLVMQDPGDEPSGAEPAVPEAPERIDEERTSTGRRRAGRTGSASVVGSIGRGRARDAADGVEVVMTSA